MGINEKRLSITDVAKAVGVTPRTIMRWEKAVEIYKRILEKSKDKRLKKVLEQRVGALEGKNR